jgi:colanic acid biosynthesis glycosyl transferase WcaI
MGEKQGLEAILHAADAYRHYQALKFVICGSGPYKEQLQNLAASLQLTNVMFFPLQPFKKFNQFLNIADIHLVIQKANASDLVMPSKLTTILAVGGIALITANKGAGLHTLVKKHNIGYLVDAENQEALNAGIGKIISEDFAAMTRNARQYAEEYLSVDNVMGSFERKFNGLLVTGKIPSRSTGNRQRIPEVATSGNYFLE